MLQRVLSAGGASAQATAVAIANAFTSGNAAACAKAVSVAIANYGCQTIQPVLARARLLLD